MGQDRFELQQRPTPEPGPGEVRVGVEVCGVCLTDVHSAEGLFGDLKPPAVLGHEVAGVVEAVGPNVAELFPGDPVVCIGSGGFAEQIVLPQNRVFRTPPGVPIERAALLEPMTACMAAVQGASIPLGATVLVTGAGPMGLIVLQLARRSGAARVLVSEPEPERRALARRMGAETTLDPRQQPVPQTVQSLTDGLGAHVAFETAGHTVPLGECLEAARHNGTVVVVGVNAANVHLDLDLYRYHPRNLTLRWSWGPAGFGDYARALPVALPWLSQLQLDELISHRFRLAEIQEAFTIARERKGLKALVQVRQ
jgi:threonine dehydrogenase-like Zn-dependent dehydrogenase